LNGVQIQENALKFYIWECLLKQKLIFSVSCFFEVTLELLSEMPNTEIRNRVLFDENKSNSWNFWEKQSVIVVVLPNASSLPSAGYNYIG
jgi:hypothetical protein